MNVPPIVKILIERVYGYDPKNNTTWFEGEGETAEGLVVTYYYCSGVRGGDTLILPKQANPPAVAHLVLL